MREKLLYFQRDTYGGKRRCLIICITSVLAATLLFGAMTVLAKSGVSEKQIYKYYTSVEIKDGDSLWSIAAAYISPEDSDMNRYIEEIKELNHLTDSSIHAGAYLTIPYDTEIECR